MRIAMAVAAVPVIGYLHYLTGDDIEFHPFFLLPVIAATWYGSALAGLLVALLSASVWFAVDWMLAGAGALGVLFLNELVRLSVLLVVVFLAARWKAALERETVLAQADPLTGLPNRRAFFDRGATELSRAHRYHHPVTALVFDLDAFKTVNDTLGHEAGDALLCVVAEVLRAHTRATDLCGRLGGDEFALLLPETGPEAALAFAATLRQRLLQAMRLHGWPVTFSIGVAVFRTPPDDVSLIVSRADALMYAIKQSGKDSIRAESI
jgi:diguanylate cyclase (GGDEF)-like protein